MGKNKLCPTISPGKTREGALGGFIGTIVVALIFSLIFKFSLLHGLAVGLMFAIAAPLGDLVESVLKRTCGIKDWGISSPVMAVFSTVLTACFLPHRLCMRILCL